MSYHRTQKLRPLPTNRFFVGRQKNLHSSTSVRWIQTSLRQIRGLSGDISKRLVGPCLLLCSGPRQFGGARACLNQWGIVMRITWTSVFSNMADINSVPNLNVVSRVKKSASGRKTDVPTNLNPIWPRQKICGSATKKSASVRQPLGLPLTYNSVWPKMTFLAKSNLLARLKFISSQTR